MVCFEEGKPFAAGLDPVTTELEDINTIRNAVAHNSRRALDQFKSLVRRKFTTAPLDITPGGFLLAAISGNPGVTYFSYYCNRLRIAARRIIPS